jgi:hypothetical protein
MMGWDLLGFHTDSVYWTDGSAPDPLTGTTRFIYDPDDLSARKGPFLPLESASARRLKDVYDTNIGPFNPDSYVLCDVFTRKLPNGVKAGMPILYYKANTANSLHLYSFSGGRFMPPDPINNMGNIYNYHDNQALIGLGKPWEMGVSSSHKLFEDPTALTPEEPGLRFYMNTKNDMITKPWRPFKAESYILISAGNDGEYGTADDVCNFDWKYREQEPPH